MTYVIQRDLYHKPILPVYIRTPVSKTRNSMGKYPTRYTYFPVHLGWQGSTSDQALQALRRLATSRSPRRWRMLTSCL